MAVMTTPQGGVISPQLSNIYLSYLDEVWQERCSHLGTLVRYCDDFVVLCRTKAQVEEAESRIGMILGRLKRWSGTVGRSTGASEVALAIRTTMVDIVLSEMTVSHDRRVKLAEPLATDPPARTRRDTQIEPSHAGDSCVCQGRAKILVRGERGRSRRLRGEMTA